jgi:hypothetical protein
MISTRRSDNGDRCKAGGFDNRMLTGLEARSRRINDGERLTPSSFSEERDRTSFLIFLRGLSISMMVVQLH